MKYIVINGLYELGYNYPLQDTFGNTIKFDSKQEAEKEAELIPHSYVLEVK